MTSAYAIAPGVRVRFWLGPYETEEGTFLGPAVGGGVLVRLDSGTVVREELARVEVVIS